MYVWSAIHLTTQPTPFLIFPINNYQEDMLLKCEGSSASSQVHALLMKS